MITATGSVKRITAPKSPNTLFQIELTAMNGTAQTNDPRHASIWLQLLIDAASKNWPATVSYDDQNNNQIEGVEINRP